VPRKGAHLGTVLGFEEPDGLVAAASGEDGTVRRMTAWSSRRVRVAWVLASVIHSTYSRRLLGLNFSNVPEATLLARKALARSSGMTSSPDRFYRF